nr:MFS transporter [Nocardia sp. CNY236]
MGELIPLYALYALLFADHGMNPGQISLLFALWAATSLLLEVPSGAWADTVSRRGLLMLSGVLSAVGFVLWIVAPSFLGFAVGFVLWGAGDALASGTFEALLYDALVLRGDAAAYPRLLGYTRAGAEAAVVVALVAATPLYLYGGYAAVGWFSVAVATVHATLALCLPATPKPVSATPEVVSEQSPVAPIATAVDRGEPLRLVTRFLGMLKAGVGEAFRVKAVRYGVLLEALLFGITAFDEYFALLAREAKISTAAVPLLIGLTVMGSLTGSAMAGRTAGMSGRTMSTVLGLAGVLLLGAALLSGLAAGRPDAAYLLAVVAFVAIGASYGIAHNAAAVAAARLQAAIEGPARATVTSVAGLFRELVALAVFALAAVVTVWWSMFVLVAVFGVAVLGIAVLTPSWLPAQRNWKGGLHHEGPSGGSPQ